MWDKKVKGDRVYWYLPNTREYFRGYIDSLMDALNTDPDTTRTCVIGDEVIYSKAKETSGMQLPAGIYRRVELDHEEYLLEVNLRKNLDIIEMDASKDVIQDINNFIESENIYRQLKVQYKRGILLYGPPGTGKTSVLHDIITRLEGESIIIFCPEEPDTVTLQALSESKERKILVFEEFTNVLGRDGEASEGMLNLLDGESSMDNCIIIASTNYPEKLPVNITQRPGRFDRMYKIGTLELEDIEKYFTHFNLDSDIPFKRFIGKTMAELKEIILLSKRDKITLEAALSLVEHHIKTAKNDFSDRKQMGFGND